MSIHLGDMAASGRDMLVGVAVCLYFGALGATINVGRQLHADALEVRCCTARDQWRDLSLRSVYSTQLVLQTMLIIGEQTGYLPNVRSDDV